MGRGYRPIPEPHASRRLQEGIFSGVNERVNIFKLVLSSILVVALSACAARKKAAPAEPEKKPAQVIGTVAMVHEELQFALIDATLIPPVGAQLKVVDAAGQETAQLTVSREKQPPFIIGNITKGLPQTGDRVLLP